MGCTVLHPDVSRTPCSKRARSPLESLCAAIEITVYDSSAGTVPCHFRRNSSWPWNRDWALESSQNLKAASLRQTREGTAMSSWTAAVSRARCESASPALHLRYRTAHARLVVFSTVLSWARHSLGRWE